jgi:hypothetical protein
MCKLPVTCQTETEEGVQVTDLGLERVDRDDDDDSVDDDDKNNYISAD